MRGGVRKGLGARAYDLYLKGRYSWNQYTEAGWNTAIGYFNQAIAIDPKYSPAWAGLADSYYQLSSLVLRPDEAIPKARTAALTALEIDDQLAEAHASLGIIKAQYDWDRTGAEKDFKRAIELDSNYATAHQWLGMYYFAGGRFADALVSLERARQLDPLSLIIAFTAVWPLANLGRYDRRNRSRTIHRGRAFVPTRALRTCSGASGWLREIGGFGAFAALAREGREPLSLSDVAGLADRRPGLAAALRSSCASRSPRTTGDAWLRLRPRPRRPPPPPGRGRHNRSGHAARMRAANAVSPERALLAGHEDQVEAVARSEGARREQGAHEGHCPPAVPPALEAVELRLRREPVQHQLEV